MYSRKNVGLVDSPRPDYLSAALYTFQYSEAGVRDERSRTTADVGAVSLLGQKRRNSRSFAKAATNDSVQLHSAA